MRIDGMKFKDMLRRFMHRITRRTDEISQALSDSAEPVLFNINLRS